MRDRGQTTIFFSIVTVTMLVGSLLGCRGDGKVKAPDIKPTEVTTGAMAAYDKNSDGALDKAEIKNTPFTLEKWDENRDGKVDQEEMTARLVRYTEKSLGLTSVHCHVTWNGQDLADAEVVLEPEPYLEGVVLEAKGTTGETGIAELAIPEMVAKDPVLTGIQPGLYRVRVTHPEIKLAARYNSDSTLVFDASPIDVLGTIELKLHR